MFMSELTNQQRDFEKSHLSLRLDQLEQDVIKAREHAQECHQAADAALLPFARLQADLDAANAAWHAAMKARLAAHEPFDRAVQAEVEAQLPVQRIRQQIADAQAAADAAEKQRQHANQCLKEVELVLDLATREWEWIHGR
jgi:hypothetical protein